MTCLDGSSALVKGSTIKSSKGNAREYVKEGKPHHSILGPLALYSDYTWSEAPASRFAGHIELYDCMPLSGMSKAGRQQ